MPMSEQVVRTTACSQRGGWPFPRRSQGAPGHIARTGTLKWSLVPLASLAVESVRATDIGTCQADSSVTGPPARRQMPAGSQLTAKHDATT